MRPLVSLLLLASTALAAQQATPPPPAPATPPPVHQPTTAADAAQRDSSFIDSEGRAHITRIVPVPQGLSFQSRFWLAEPVAAAGPPESLDQRRAGTDKWAVTARDQWLQLYPAKLTEDRIAGVPVRIVVPEDLT